MSRVICILGMHRSGTSALTGVLQEAGLALGDVSTKPSPFNQKGHRELSDIYQLNDRILADNGGAWEQPPAIVEWQAEHRERRDAIIGGFAGREVWGFKDPRTLLTLDGWREALPNAQFVGTIRDPRAVAQSLAYRNGFSFEQGFALWQRYNTPLLELFNARPFPVVSFDLPPAGVVASMQRVIDMLELPGSGGGIRFFEGQLRHMTPGDTPLPAPLAALYRQLRERVIMV